MSASIRATPQAAGRLTSPAEPAPVVAQEPSAEWKFEVTGYFRAPMRFSWGPATTTAPPCVPVAPATTWFTTAG